MLLFNFEFDIESGPPHWRALASLSPSPKLGRSASMRSSCKSNFCCNFRQSNQNFRFLLMITNVTITNVTIEIFLVVPSTEYSVSTVRSGWKSYQRFATSLSVLGLCSISGAPASV